MIRGIEKKNRTALEKLHRDLAGPFDMADAARVLRVSRDRAGRLLRQLSAHGWLSRIRRGLYVTVPLGASEPSAWREDPWRVAASVFAPSYIGGWSACEHWELTEQVFRGVVVMTARSLRTTESEVQGNAFRLKHLPEDLHFGTRSVWRDRTRVKVSDPTRTLIDVLDDPRLGGGIRHVSAVVSEYLSGMHRDERRLLDYGDRLGNRTVFKRLGFIVESLELGAPSLVEACRARVSKGLGRLDPSVVSRGRVLKRWGLRVNVELSREDPA
jgi:predicted transcriptional regulator of viral defense system